MAPLSNRDIADFVEEYSVLLELSGANAFRLRAYTNGARIFENLDTPIEDLVASGGLDQIKGVGNSLAQLVSEYVNTGSSQTFDQLKSATPPGLLEMLKVQGLGAKKVKAIQTQLGIDTLDDLALACSQGTLSQLSGFGKKTEEKILASIQFLRQSRGRFHFHTALEAANTLATALLTLDEIDLVELSGQARRGRESLDRLDLAVVTNCPQDLADALAKLPLIAAVDPADTYRIDLRLTSGLAATLHLTDAAQLPLVLCRSTGSAPHWQQLTERADRLGLQLDKSHQAFADEKAVYAALELPWIDPALREGLDEVEAAASGTLPELVRADDIRGMLHVHSTYSDGQDSLAAMADAVRQRGYAYLGICDHSQSAAYAGGLKPKELEQQIDEIDALNEGYEEFRILKGIESDILTDGSLDYSDTLLARLDFVVISIHSQFNMQQAEMTQRILQAMAHPKAAIVGHLTGRLLLQRKGYPVDIDAIIEGAARFGVALEINANPHRLDLDWRHVRKARDKGVKLAINTDAHRIAHLDYIGLGVTMGRKGWLQRQDIINCLGPDELLAHFAASKP